MNTYRHCCLLICPEIQNSLMFVYIYTLLLIDPPEDLNVPLLCIFLRSQFLLEDEEH